MENIIDIKKIQREKPISELLRFSIINIDKPSGQTSFQVSQFVKEALGLNKTSHFGTLDPAVSGVLPVALGRACRLNEYFMHSDKEYVGIMRLHSDVSDEILQREIKKFIGKIKQIPPVRSRVKRAERIREVKKFEILEREGKDVLFLAEVQAGTYIRKLCDDLGKEIGGGHMLELRRIKAGVFEEKESINLYELEKAVDEYKKGNGKLLREILIPGEKVCEILQSVQVKKETIRKLLTGSPIFLSFIEDTEEIKRLQENEKICAFNESRFIGCYRVIRKGDLIGAPEFVFN